MLSDYDYAVRGPICGCAGVACDIHGDRAKCPSYRPLGYTPGSKINPYNPLRPVPTSPLPTPPPPPLPKLPEASGPVRYGWICPRCSKVHAPFVPSCPCEPEKEKEVRAIPKALIELQEQIKERQKERDEAQGTSEHVPYESQWTSGVKAVQQATAPLMDDWGGSQPDGAEMAKQRKKARSQRMIDNARSVSAESYYSK